MAWPEPTNSRNQVRNAGKRIVESYRKYGMLAYGIYIPSEDFQTVQNWRAAHGAVLNTAQAWLRRLDEVQRPVVGQRLKRFDTIVDKLITGRSKDLSTMHDIAGVRAIFRNEADLRDFQDKAARSKARHTLTHETGKFDYISCPKSTGYRGVHQVYARQVPAKSGEPWNGLKFEVQLRTACQHAWATAIEVYDSTAQARFKFEASSNPAYEQFLIISEMFARIHEDRRGSLPHLSDQELVLRQRELERETHMVSTIQSLMVAQNAMPLNRNTILQRRKNGELYIYKYKSFALAIQAIAQIEASSETENAVLVGASTPNHIRIAFRNYFDDTADFVNLLREAEEEIGI